MTENIEASQVMLTAAKSGNEADLAKALAAGANVDASDSDGMTAAMYAVRHGHEACLSRLIAAGSDLDARNHKGATAAMQAARRGHVPCVLALAAAKADLASTDDQGWTAAMHASEGRHAKLATLIDSLILSDRERSQLDSSTHHAPGGIDRFVHSSELVPTLLPPPRLATGGAPPEPCGQTHTGRACQLPNKVACRPLDCPS